MDDIYLPYLMLLLLAALVFKHFVVDFVIQRPRHFLNKGIYGHWGGIEHALQHGVLTWAVLFLFTDARFALTMGIFDSLIHYHVDWFKMRFGEKDNTKNAYWIWFGVDQLMHQLTYITVIYFMITVFYPN